MDTNGSKGWEGGPLDCGGLEASSFCPLGLRGVVVLGEEGVIGEVGSPSLFDSFGFDRDERRLFGGGVVYLCGGRCCWLLRLCVVGRGGSGCVLAAHDRLLAVPML